MTLTNWFIQTSHFSTQIPAAANSLPRGQHLKPPM